MKKIIIMLLFVFAIPLSAQQVETLFGEGEITHGGFGAPVVKFTNINGQFGLLLGGRGGWVTNHQFVIGGGGYGLVNQVEGNEIINGSKRNLIFGYGGLELEYIHEYKKLVHLTFYLLLGGGVVYYRNWWDYQGRQEDAFFIAEPAVSIETNIMKFFSAALSTSYRLTSGVEDRNLSNRDLNGLAFSVTLKFGKF